MAESNHIASATVDTIPSATITLRSDYKTAAVVGKILHRNPKTIRKWVCRFRLGRRHGVFKMPGGGFLFFWPVYEKEFVQKQGADEEGESI